VPRLDEADLFRLLDRVYDVPGETKSWSAMVEMVAAQFHGCAALVSQDPSSAASVHEWAGLDPAMRISYEAHYSKLKPWLARLCALPSGELADLAYLTTQPAYEKSEYYNDWVKPQANYWLLGAIFDKAHARSGYLTILRAKARGDFDADELAFCRKLAPHLSRAMRLHHKLAAVQREGRGAMEAVDRLATGLILADRSARIVFANRLGETLLREADGLRAVAGELHAARADVTKKLHGLIAQSVDVAMGSSADPGSVLRIARADGTALGVLVCPLRPGDSGIHPYHAPLAALLLSDGGRVAAPRGTAFERLYGLTPTQADLLTALLDGERLAAYAERRGVKLDTVRFHLKQIFEKTGATRQADLVRQILANPFLSLAGGG
jgi:DNA-binding CsgD family transcriptional regulator